MAKTKISEFSSTPGNNTDINGINIAEGCAPSGINNAIRQLMADLKDFQTGSAGDNLTVGGNLSVTGTTSLVNQLGVTSGGTGIKALAAGDILYASTTDTFARLTGAGTTGSVLLSGTVVPSWGKVPLATHVSGALPPANGGTGTTSLTSKAVVIGNGTDPVSAVSPSSSGNVLVSDGTDWTSAALSSLTVFGKSLSANGYQKLPGGMIIQWGTFTSTADGAESFSWPTAFASSCLIAVANWTGDISYNVPITETTTTAFKVDRNNNIGGSQNFKIIALGV